MTPALTLTLTPDDASPGRARALVRQHFADRLAPRRSDVLELVLTELVTNAVKYGEGDVVVRLQLDGEIVRGEVIDQGGGFEREIRRRGADEVGGRGLFLVETMTDRWGVHEGSTHVWFELSSTETAREPSKPDPELGQAKRPELLG